MNALLQACLRHPRRVLVAWAMLAAAAAVFAVRLPDAVRGSASAVEDSESGRVTAGIHRHFGQGVGYPFTVVIRSERPSADAALAASAASIAAALENVPGVRTVQSQGVGRDGRSMLLVVVPASPTFFEAENLTRALRKAVAEAGVVPGISASVTGMPAVFHDLNRKSSAELLRAESMGVPIALLLLLFAFGAPLAAALPLVTAGVAVTVACAGLYLLRDHLPVSVFAQNCVSIIGLGLGVDYSLIFVSRLRAWSARLSSHAEAVSGATEEASRPILIAGSAVAIGCSGLFLVRAQFVHSIAFAGLLVVTAAVAATLTLLPALLLLCQGALHWPLPNALQPRSTRRWAWWAGVVAKYPRVALCIGLAVAAALTLPAARISVGHAGVHDLGEEFEARTGYDGLVRDFEPGWMGPLAILSEPALKEEPLASLREHLAADARVASVRELVAPGGEAALFALVMRHAPDSAEAFAYVRALQEELRAWPGSVRVGGPTAMIADFDAEIFGSLWRIVPAVLAASFAVLLIAFRSPVVALKAVALNVLSVLAAYGFLALAFPAGLNALVVLMLFTLLFGISMDYEVFLVAAMRDRYRISRSNRSAVKDGLAETAPVLSSAASIMVALFASFSLAELAATRQFGLGLAFAVALDATLIRLLLLPAAMELLGAANWWWPGRKGGGRLPAG